MGVLDFFGGGEKNQKEPKLEPESVQAKSALDIVQGLGKKAAPGAKRSDDDDYEFEDIEEIRRRHGFKHGAKRQAVGHSWGEIAIGTASSCAMMGAFGALMGLSMGAITGPMFAPKGQRLPVTIGLMKKQAVWFGVIFGGGGGIIGAIRKYG
mmetsp:Transcript_61751/g.152025  ORF Transcript_61751/g.152025 Transcript_61751/m.152025 type:complete len:152 (-) Transcript_61751:1845-2300(-)